MPFIATGVVGAGSECFGYDDAISRDHDFEPGFCIFLPNEETVTRRDEFELERAYARLPREYAGYARCSVSAVGGGRHGVIRMSEFFESKTGKRDGRLSKYEYFGVPEQALLEATNGKVFFDGYGELTRTRECLAELPKDVRLKKLAGEILIMGQAGQYNYPRCIARGERGAAQLAVNEFVNAAMHVVFLLNRRYMPYYKWRFRALRELERGKEYCDAFEYLISSGNGESEVIRKTRTVEMLCEEIGRELCRSGLTRHGEGEMERAAYEVNNGIRDAEIRNMHILAAI